MKSEQAVDVGEERGKMGVARVVRDSVRPSVGGGEAGFLPTYGGATVFHPQLRFAINAMKG